MIWIQNKKNSSCQQQQPNIYNPGNQNQSILSLTLQKVENSEFLALSEGVCSFPFLICNWRLFVPSWGNRKYLILERILIESVIVAKQHKISIWHHICKNKVKFVDSKHGDYIWTIVYVCILLGLLKNKNRQLILFQIEYLSIYSEWAGFSVLSKL